MHLKIKVKQGTVIGGEGILPNGKRYHYFKGIPYAVPPLGELRFKAPVPLESFEFEELYCLKERNVACQCDSFTRKPTGSEDCLFLNVYVPQTEGNAPLPVMVFIHGGAYVMGSGNSDLYNPLYLMQEGVVVVTLNYRLGVFGFLSLPEGNIPGNAGLKDQRLALQWVHENISQFNGDPNNVTLFGESAGATCAHFHILSKNSRKFFQRAILQSGIVTHQWSWEANPKQKALYIAKALGCNSEDPLEIVEFLQGCSNIEGFLKPYVPEHNMDDYLFGHKAPCQPVLEKDSPEAVFTQETFDSLNTENSTDMPLMMGYNSAEAILMLPCVHTNLNYYDKHLDLFIPPDILRHLDDRCKAEVADKLRDFYFLGKRLTASNLQSFCNLMTDYFFAIAANEYAETHSQKQPNTPLFFYRFDVDEALNIYKRKVKMEHIRGASHVDDLFYIFQLAKCPEPWDSNAKDIVLKMCRMWANFAKYGNPTPRMDGYLIDCIWEPVGKSKDAAGAVNALSINRKLSMIGMPDAKRMEFWKKIKQDYVRE